MCCRKGWVGNGCDGNIGGPHNHQCAAAPKGNKTSIRKMLIAQVNKYYGIILIFHITVKIQELTLRRVLAYKIKEKIVGGAVDEEKENALGVETECAVERVGLETVVMEPLADDVITNVSPNQKVIDHVL